MTKISQYPEITTPDVSDLLVGTDVENSNVTKNFTIQSVIDLVQESETPSLQEVTDVGTVTTNSIAANSFIKTGGLSTQFLKANGSVDSNTYALISDIPNTPTLQDVVNHGNNLEDSYIDFIHYGEGTDYLKISATDIILSDSSSFNSQSLTTNINKSGIDVRDKWQALASSLSSTGLSINTVGEYGFSSSVNLVRHTNMPLGYTIITLQTPNKVSGTYTIATLDDIPVRPYKVYTALLSQGGTSAPTAIVLENTLSGIISWTYQGVGLYRGILTAAFAFMKTTVDVRLSQGSIESNRKVGFSIISEDAIQINTWDNTTLINGILSSSMGASIEIRVYE